MRCTIVEPSAPSAAASDAHFAAAIVRLRKKWWLPARNAATSSPPWARERGGEVADEEVAGRLAAHVQLVAHLQALRREAEDVDRARCARAAAASDGPSAVAQEALALDGLVVADPEPEASAPAPR